MDWEWQKLYQPIRFGFADTVLGNKEEYETMIKACNEIGLKIVQDVVLRHTASCDTDCLKLHCKVDDEIKKLKKVFQMAIQVTLSKCYFFCLKKMRKGIHIKKGKDKSKE